MGNQLTTDRRRVGPYTLVKRLGAGGMGEVFLGRSTAGLAVAVKIVNPGLVGDEAFRARFRREAMAARSVSGAFTAPVIDADVDSAQPWLATAYLPGASLQDAVAAHGPMPAESVFALAAGLAEALVSIHGAGVVHRDLKPSNVMLTPDGPKVIDFGIAHGAEAETVTRTGQVIGTPGFMSPEQATGGDTGPAGDVCCLGAVLAFAATGHSPYGEGTPEVLIYRNAYEEPRIDEIRDPRLRDLIAGCMARDPARRPTAETLLERLSVRPVGMSWLPGPLAAEVEARARSATRLLGRRRRRRVLIASVVAVGVIAVAAVAPELGLEDHPPPACDSDCQRLADGEQAFYQSWKPKLAALNRCTNEKSCMKAADAIEEPMRTAIRVRPDASRYDGVQQRLDDLHQARKEVDTCFDNPFAKLAVACARAWLTQVRGYGQTLDFDLSMVPLTTESGAEPTR